MRRAARVSCLACRSRLHFIFNFAMAMVTVADTLIFAIVCEVRARHCCICTCSCSRSAAACAHARHQAVVCSSASCDAVSRLTLAPIRTARILAIPAATSTMVCQSAEADGARRCIGSDDRCLFATTVNMLVVPLRCSRVASCDR